MNGKWSRPALVRAWAALLAVLLGSAPATASRPLPAVPLYTSGSGSVVYHVSDGILTLAHPAVAKPDTGVEFDAAFSFFANRRNAYGLLAHGNTAQLGGVRPSALVNADLVVTSGLADGFEAFDRTIWPYVYDQIAVHQGLSKGEVIDAMIKIREGNPPRFGRQPFICMWCFADRNWAGGRDGLVAMLDVPVITGKGIILPDAASKGVAPGGLYVIHMPARRVVGVEIPATSIDLLKALNEGEHRELIEAFRNFLNGTGEFPHRALLEVQINQTVGQNKRPRVFKAVEGGACPIGGCPDGINCFVKRTPVSTPAGPRPIESLHAGDLVYSEAEDGNGLVAPRRILKTIVTPDVAVVDLKLEGPAGEETLGVTADHPFWIEGFGWTTAGALLEGDVVRNANAPALVRVAAVTPHPQHETVYNFEVEGFHTYFVGKNQTWAHNSGCPRRGGFRASGWDFKVKDVRTRVTTGIKVAQLGAGLAGGVWGAAAAAHLAMWAMGDSPWAPLVSFGASQIGMMAGNWLGEYMIVGAAEASAGMLATALFAPLVADGFISNYVTESTKRMINDMDADEFPAMHREFVGMHKSVQGPWYTFPGLRFGARALVGK